MARAGKIGGPGSGFGLSQGKKVFILFTYLFGLRFEL
jgi:hypothetical protein